VSVAGPSESPNRPLLTGSLMLATLMVGLDTTIANVALPHMMGSVSASADQITWVLTSYIVASAITTPLTGWLEARLGRKVIFLTAVAGFVGASMLCGLAGSLSQIVFFRVLQGVFSASLPPLAQTQLLDMNPPERHGPAMALFGMGSLLGPMLGPAIGGYLTEHFSWRWVFYINLPVGAVAFAGFFLLMREPPRTARRRFDFIGFGMLALFIASFQLMLDRGSDQDWFSSTEIWAEAILAAIALWMFIFYSASAKNPFFDPRLLADRNFLGSFLLSAVLFTLTGSSLALLPPLLQTLLGYPVQTAGLIMMPRGMGTVAGMFVVGRLVTRVDARLLLLMGLLLLALAAWQMTHFDLSMNTRPILVSGLTQGLGLGLIMVPISTSAFVTLPPPLRAEGSALLSIARYMSQSVGISMMQALLTRNTQAMHAALASHVVASDPVVSQQLGAGALASPAGALALDAEINRQALMVAYVDDFKLMMVIAFVCIPFLLLIRGPRRDMGQTLGGRA
jgi:DHA2 family multidrug resistance protein